MFKFIHAADIHLDSPLLNLQQYDGAPEHALRVATREAFDNVVQLAIEEQVRFVLIAGDLYDQESPNFHTPIHVRQKMRELATHGISVFLIQGNHDATAEAKRAFSLAMPDNVRVFSTRRPETEVLDDVQVAIHGQGFAQRAIEEDLSARYPDALPGYFNIGLLHTNLGGHASHDNYAPSTRSGLTSKQYQYWALGHIHKRNTSIGPNPHIIYPGNTQGRHIRESGAKGCVLVTVNEERQASVTFRATDVWRWELCEVDVSECQVPLDVLDAVLEDVAHRIEQVEDRSLAVRVQLQGATEAHHAWLQQADHWRERLQVAFLDRFDDRVWLEKIVSRTSPVVQSETSHLDVAWGELVAQIHEAIPQAAIVDSVRDEARRLLSSLPKDARLAGGVPDLADPDQLEALWAEAKQRVVAELLDRETPS